MSSLSHAARCWILVAIAVLAVLGMSLVGPIAQDPGYHAFADQRALLGLDHFWNVVSNLPFLLVGGYGLARVSRLGHAESATAYLVMCLGITLVGIGSAYYHQAPTNATLLWDRLPMTVAFMALVSLLLTERVLRREWRPLLGVLVVVGVASALYWSWTESRGQGDLRPYALVQFLAMACVPLCLILFRARYLNDRLLAWTFALYVVAKAFEHFDHQVLAITGLTGGHAMKHLVAAAAVLCIIHAVPTKEPHP